MDLDERVRVAGLPDFDTVKFFRVLAQAGLDPAQPVELSVRTTRAHGLHCIRSASAATWASNWPCRHATSSAHRRPRSR